ncbi:hypothetical protein EBR66_03950 [bacterium]|nr:hypothetical protein [bacterium]
MTLPKVYVGCALTHAPESFKEMVAQFKAQLARAGYAEILDFVDMHDSTPTQAYDHDIGCVRSCDALIAFLDLPSLGLGMELQEAIVQGKAVLCLCPT